MYRVVLIDDERRIVDGLSKVVKWNDYRCQVVGTAYDAESGAAVIREKQPHILFTDIRMPGQDGLAMLAGLRSEFPDLKVIVLTGYRDFEYAREAIRLGVFRFLTKPSRMDEIHEALQSAVEKLDASAGKVHVSVFEEESAGESAPESEESSNAGRFVIHQAMEYMQDHYGEKLTLQSVADQCYVSQWHLSKLLNRYAGKSFYDVLNEIRIRKARELLADPRLRIGEISELVGYADTAHFARIFKKYEGVSANEYRNSL